MSAEIEITVIELCTLRGPDKTICPSEAARLLAGEGGDWRALMPKIRIAAARLVLERKLIVTQRGRPVDPLEARGPIRIGLADKEP